MLWLYFEFPRLQLETQYPDRDKAPPLAVVKESDNRLVQVNEPASQQGVKRDMGLATAATLCRDIQLLPYKAELEVHRLHELAQELYALSGEVVLDEPCGVWLGATNMVKYHNGFDNYCRNIELLLQHCRLSYRLGCGYSPLAAQLLARAHLNRAEDDPERLREHIGRCALPLSGLPDKTLEKLKRLGLQSLDALLAIPLKELARRFDAELVQYIGRLTGQLKHPLPFYHPPEHFHRYRELPHELDNVRLLVPWLEQLLQELEQFLQRRDRVVERLELRLYPREAEALTLTIGAARGEYRAEQWRPLVELTLENQTLNAPVYALALEARELLVKEDGERDFFEAPARGDAPQLVARLQARLGREQVRGLCVRDDFRPAIATALTSPLSATDPLPAFTLGLRPSFLLSRPQPYRQPLELIEGPERIATGWWDGEPQKRDYYIARNSEGQWCWVFREPREAVWFLQGYFG
ncbi:Y-family DNA polymerase [Marinimicrobium sp. C2-29]|uniref:Y-family DNA polymerase n=1 Tax=Marinimicrobium sp. C2-29 TaxID=3139825 RepID=UPI00313A1BB8